MKRILLSMLAAVSFAALTAHTSTLAMADYWGSEDCDLAEWSQQGFTFTPALGENPKDKVPVYKKKNQEVRFYALNTLTVTSGMPMTAITFTLSKQGIEEQAEITASEGAIGQQTVGCDKIIWTGNSMSVTFTVGAANTLHTDGIAEGSGQLDFTAVEISTDDQAGLTAIQAERQKEVFYNLQGIKVDNPAPGAVYIRISGSDIRKIIL